MDILTGWFLANVLPWIVAGGAALLAIIFRLRENEANNRAQEAQGYGTTRRKMDGADTGAGDPDNDRQWLSARDPDKR